MQQLIPPINACKNNASIDTPAYFDLTESLYGKNKGFQHYGTDFVSTAPITDKTRDILWGMGIGKVIACGWDNACGYVLSVLYKDAYNWKKDIVKDVNIRMYHMAAIYVKKGDSVTTGTMLGRYGMTGKYAGTGPHLHMEADYDVNPTYALYTPTVTTSNLLKGTKQGAYEFTDKRNTVFNVCELLHIKSSAPDSQTYTTASDKYIRAEDKKLPAFAEKTPAEIAVDRMIIDGIITDRAYWLGVLNGTTVADKSKLLTVFENYISKTA